MINASVTTGVCVAEDDGRSDRLQAARCFARCRGHFRGLGRGSVAGEWGEANARSPRFDGSVAGEWDAVATRLASDGGPRGLAAPRLLDESRPSPQKPSGFDGAGGRRRSVEQNHQRVSAVGHSVCSNGVRCVVGLTLAVLAVIKSRLF